MNTLLRVFVTVIGGLMMLVGFGVLLGTSQVAAQERPTSPTVSVEIPGEWNSTPVDAPKRFLKLAQRRIQIGANGNVHLVYGGDHLYYARYDGVDWRIETVDADAQVGEFATLALDSSGRPHIGYFANAQNQIRYAWHDGTTWQKSIVVTLVEGPVDLSFVLSNDNVPHFAFAGKLYIQMNLFPTYMWWDGAAWQTEYVVSESAKLIALDLTSAGRPYIAYIHDYRLLQYPMPPTTQGLLKAGLRTDTGWEFEQVDSFDDINAMNIALELDTVDRPHIVYTKSSQLFYSYHDGQRWEKESLDEPDSFLHGLSMVLDTGNQPAVSYVVRNSTTIADFVGVSRRIGGQWQRMSVSPISESTPGAFSVMEHYTSITFDQSGQLALSYYDLGDLRVAFRDGDSWQRVTVDSEADVGCPSGLAIDQLDYPHIAYYDCLIGHGHVKYAYQDESGWHTQMVELFAAPGRRWSGSERASIAVDGANRPHVAYQAVDTDTGDPVIRYAVLSGGSWLSETIAYGRSPALALDQFGFPHLAYAQWPGEPPNPALRYAWFDGASWHTETVVADYAREIALVLDSQGDPGIGFVRSDSAEIKIAYAQRTVDGWSDEIVDVKLSQATTLDVAIDSYDQPHVAYLAGDTWKYARYTTTGWITETLDAYARGGQQISLALDKVDQPHATYYGGVPIADSDLIYTWRDAQGWHSLPVTELTDYADEYANLALDRAGRAHISYYDSGNADLYFATLWPSLTLDAYATPDRNVQPGESFTVTLGIIGRDLLAAWRLPIPIGTEYVVGSLNGPGSYLIDANALAWSGRLPVGTIQLTQFQLRMTQDGQGNPITASVRFTDTERGRSATALVIVNSRHTYLPQVQKMTP